MPATKTELLPSAIGSALLAASAAEDARNGWRRFFTGAGLPIFLLAAAAIYESFLLMLVFAPLESGWLGGFAREFKVWCFSYDPRTGGMEWSSVGMMLMEPLFVLVVAVVLWRRALQSARWLQSWRPAACGIAAALLAITSLLSLGARGAADETLPPFPGERIRTHLIPPSFRLVDQTGRECALEDLRGRVVLVTGIYAMCGTTCPQILVETRKLLDSLPAGARSQVTVLALSLNPEYETAELMASVAAGYGFTHPEFRYLNGKPAEMHGVLDAFQFARFRDAKTGLIEHANLLMLLDARGEIAYRFNLNPRHQVWLREAVLQLAAEARAEPPVPTAATE
ncbi:MAG: SCO family protein [Opitutaceae bacterium]|nr:SCO family protein [Opitutaceae bacterium]